jgi:hypothetical protein
MAALLTMSAAVPASAAAGNRPAAPDRASASAACWLEITGDGVRFRTEPNASSTVIGLLYRGDRIDPWDGSWVNGWQHGYSPKHGRWGWVNAAYTLAYC